MSDTRTSTAATGTDRAFVLGLDGVPWNLLEQWASAGELPNVQRLMTEGASGPLESTTPATTALAWPTLATGVNADKHGSYGFRQLRSDYSHRMNTSDTLRATPLWHRLTPTVVGNVPMTYPAQPVDGELVTGMMTPTFDERATHPPELAAELRDAIPEYEIGLDWNEYHGRPEELIADLTSVLAARRRLMQTLMDREDWRLFFFVYTAPDRLQHLVWDETRILEQYRLLDEIVGEVLEYVDRLGATLFVVSDHGFGPVDRLVNVNTVLERAGYLTRAKSSGTRGALARAGLGKDTVRSVLDRAGIDESTLLGRLPDALVERVASTIPGDHVLFDVDFGETTAFCYGPGTVYVNDTERFEQGCVSPGERQRIRDAVRATLQALRDPDTGKRVLQVHDGPTLFPTDEDAPDLVVRGRDGYYATTSLESDPFSTPETLNATHRSEGVALAWGPAIEAGARLEAAEVADLAPTLLHLVGEPVPADTDGRVWTEAFEPGSEPATRPVERGDPDTGRRASRTDDATDADRDEEMEVVGERLRGLGYLD